jgi:hypothetical protein
MNTERKSTKAWLDWSLTATCPHCLFENDLVEYDCYGDYEIAKKIFSNNWDALKNYEIECQNCEQEFLIDKVEY